METSLEVLGLKDLHLNLKFVETEFNDSQAIWTAIVIEKSIFDQAVSAI